MRSGQIAAGHGLMFSWAVVDGRWRPSATELLGVERLLSDPDRADVFSPFDETMGERLARLVASRMAEATA
jgi:hypothetical protein